MISSYVTNLFSAGNTEWTSVIDCIDGRVSGDMNNILLSEVEKEEVFEALMQTHPDKSPGSDGFTPGFFQKYWEVVGDDVIQLVKDFFFCFGLLSF